MSLVDVWSQFDVLGVAVLIGSLLFLGALIWVLIDRRDFERWRESPVEEPTEETPRRPTSPRRAA